MSPKKKHIAFRTCVVCRKKVDKRQMTRIVRSPEGEISIDPSGKANGRGAYLCDDPACWAKATETNILAAPLKTAITDETRQMIADYHKKMTE